MISEKKKQFLLSQGRSQETIDFVKKCKVPSKYFVWFVTRIEKDEVNLNDKDLKNKVSKIVKLLKISTKDSEKNSFQQLYKTADKFFENDENVESRILYKFKDGAYVINLTPKELYLESQTMCNCLSDYRHDVARNSLAILAIKNKNHKSLVDFEITTEGFLKQHYGKANSYVQDKNWSYVAEFFKENNDKFLLNHMKEKGFSINYKVENSDGLPSVHQFLPISKTNSLIHSNDSSFEGIRLKNFFTLNLFKSKTSIYNSKEVKKIINEYVKTVSEEANKLIKSIDDSTENIFILNDDIIKKVFGKVKYEKLDKLAIIKRKHSSVYYSCDESISKLKGGEETIGEMDISNLIQNNEEPIEDCLEDAESCLDSFGEEECLKGESFVEEISKEEKYRLKEGVEDKLMPEDILKEISEEEYMSENESMEKSAYMDKMSMSEPMSKPAPEPMSEEYFEDMKMDSKAEDCFEEEVIDIKKSN